MERRYPLIDVGLGLAEQLLSSVSDVAKPRSVQLLSGGHVNTNYAVQMSDGEKLVLRIYSSGETAFAKETEILRKLTGSVAVPRVKLAAAKHDGFKHPYAVLDWIEGVPLNRVLLEERESASEIADVLAAILINIRDQNVAVESSVSVLEAVRCHVSDQNVAQQLGEERSSRLWNLVQENSAMIDEFCTQTGLVHGDFQGDNILLEKTSGKWRVNGILDWEWAHNGCFLRDVGSLLRYPAESSEAFMTELEAGFSRRGVPLPSRWITASRIWDLVPNCEKLTSPTNRGDVTLRALGVIDRCLNDYAAA
jgi:aminoglycoside phosphotransferase (APT) family kinase protein